MDSDERNHFEAMLKAYLRRLRALELQEAQLGADVPPQVYIEIQDIRPKIAQLEPQLGKDQVESLMQVGSANILKPS